MIPLTNLSSLARELQVNPTKSHEFRCNPDEFPMKNAEKFHEKSSLNPIQKISFTSIHPRKNPIIPMKIPGPSKIHWNPLKSIENPVENPIEISHENPWSSYQIPPWEAEALLVAPTHALHIAAVRLLRIKGHDQLTIQVYRLRPECPDKTSYIWYG